MTRDPFSTKAPDAGVPLAPVLAGRWSPRGFDSSHVMDDATITCLLEAARWSPSASNSQPWRFLVTLRGTLEFATVVTCLADANQVWARHASCLVVACARTSDDEGRSLRWSAYDLGQAVASLTVQAESLDLSVHQMGGFSVEAIRKEFDLGDSVDPLVVVAIGRFDPAADLPEGLLSRESAPRERRQLSEILLDAAQALRS